VPRPADVSRLYVSDSLHLADENGQWQETRTPSVRVSCCPAPRLGLCRPRPLVLFGSPPRSFPAASRISPSIGKQASQSFLATWRRRHRGRYPYSCSVLLGFTLAVAVRRLFEADDVAEPVG
jgi:hypothetical protein